MLVFSELEVAYLENVESLPVTNLQKGRIVWDETNTRASIYTGSAWRHLVDHINALSNPMTTAGDVIKAGASGVPERLAIGSANTLLKSNGSTPSWGQVSNSDVANDAAIAGSKVAAATSSTAGTISKEYDSGWVTHTDGVSFSMGIGGSAPSGTNSRYYRYTRLGKVVNFWIRAEYATAGVKVESVSFQLPASMPTPDWAANVGSSPSEDGFAASGFTLINNGGSPKSVSCYAYLQRNTSNPRLFIGGGEGLTWDSLRFMGHVTYIEA